MSDLRFVTHHQTLAERCMLVAYTDGLIESTANIIDGQCHLAEIVANVGLDDAARPATFMRERILGDAVDDDTAILSVRIDTVRLCVQDSGAPFVVQTSPAVAALRQADLRRSAGFLARRDLLTCSSS